MSKLKPKIYVACLAAYNNGQLHGCWLDATQSVDALHQEIQNMLSESPEPFAEEWAIHDFEDFAGYSLEEYTSLETVVSIAELISEYEKLGVAVLTYTGGNLEQSRAMLEEQYHGFYDSEEDFVESFLEETHEIPKYLVNYIDYELMARDWFMSDFMSFQINHQVAVFSTC